MSIFRKGRDTTPSPPQPSAPSPSLATRPQNPTRREPSAPAKGSTFIARGTKVVGEITGDAELVIEGVVEGEIYLDSAVVVGAEGKVQGMIEAVSVKVSGKVFGNIHGMERVEVLATGGLEGDIVSPSIEIAAGAFYKGKVDMSSPVKKGGSGKGAKSSAQGSPKGGPGGKPGNAKPGGNQSKGGPGAGSKPTSGSSSNQPSGGKK